MTAIFQRIRPLLTALVLVIAANCAVSGEPPPGPSPHREALPEIPASALQKHVEYLASPKL
ncbi:MAG: hypothetical protein JSS02_07125, partial [Planctomycetes bacterium]|nr:hypothetical protein [Planctomycetota bacterium]